jgi:membrane dipeptidase
VTTYGTPEARALHARYPAIDFHADSLMWARWWGYDLHARHDPPLPRAALGGHVDVPRLVEGGFGAQFFGLVPPVFLHAGFARVVDEQIDALDRAVAQDPSRLAKVRTAADIRAARARGAMGALLGIEGAHALEGDADRLDAFARRGVRYLGLSHFRANAACYPAYGFGRADEEGLTAHGRELVRRCEALGVIVDLAHINRRGFMEACAMAQRPPIVSHTGVLGAFEHWRNIGDDQLRAVADKGGLVGVIFCPRYVGGDGVGYVVKHLQHILDVCGEDTPALGSDWDGFIVPTGDLCDAAHLPLLTDALLAAGVREEVIGKILHGNAMRVLEDG